jgi:hypothetical protein
MPFRELPCPRIRNSAGYGVYQIGDVYARSCVDTGAPSGIEMPKRKASIVDQRGVGISKTRA